MKSAASGAFGPTEIFLAYAYGSRVVETDRPDSDLDIGYYLESYIRDRVLSIHQEMVLETNLSEALGFEVDLRNLESAPLEVRGRVLEDGIRIYCCDEVKRVNLEHNLLTRYHDYKPSMRQCTRNGSGI